MSKIVVNNVELTLNLLDADEMEKYETEMRAVSTTIKDNAQYAGLSVPQAMRKQCRIIEAFFDKLFGAGTAEKLFGGNNDVGAHAEAFGQVSQMAKETGAEIRSISEKYGAARLANREQRRNAGVTVVNGGKQHSHYSYKKRHH